MFCFVLFFFSWFNQCENCDIRFFLEQKMIKSMEKNSKYMVSNFEKKKYLVYEKRQKKLSILISNSYSYSFR